MRRSVVLILGVIIISAACLGHAGRKRLQIQISKSDINLAERTIYFKLNRPADSAEIKVYSATGALVAERVTLYDGAKAGTRLSISWPESLEAKDNFRIALKVTDVDEYWVTHEIVRFYVEIPHEEVVFETGKWEIRPSETPKLDDALAKLIAVVKKHRRDMDCQVYVAGHTDTVGSVADNRRLSNNRARSIAKYFVKHGLKGIPIFVRGFGEEAPLVDTGDNVDEERNRRATYIISTFPPDAAGPGSWQRLK